MSNMTNRLSDSQFAEIAKQKYQTQRTNQIPGIVVELPTKGLVYPESSVLRNGTVEMRFMTAYDEDILTNKSYIQKLIVFDKLIESVVTTEGFNVNELVEADKEWLIIMIRISSYDELYPVTITTPDKQTISATIDLRKLTFKQFDLKPDSNGEFDYQTESGDKLKFKYIPSSILNKAPSEQTISYLLKNQITQINDIRDKHEIEDWIRYKFLRKDSSKFRNYMYDNRPSVNLTYNFEYTTTEGKLETFEAGFPIGPDFFWL